VERLNLADESDELSQLVHVAPDTRESLEASSPAGLGKSIADETPEHPEERSPALELVQPDDEIRSPDQLVRPLGVNPLGHPGG
jgi:hypothetical protein